MVSFDASSRETAKENVVPSNCYRERRLCLPRLRSVWRLPSFPREAPTLRMAQGKSDAVSKDTPPLAAAPVGHSEKSCYLNLLTSFARRNELHDQTFLIHRETQRDAHNG